MPLDREKGYATTSCALRLAQPRKFMRNYAAFPHADVGTLEKAAMAVYLLDENHKSRSAFDLIKT